MNVGNKLKSWYTAAQEEIKTKLSRKHTIHIPRIEKIVVNAGVKEAVSKTKSVSFALDLLEKVTGQKPVTRVAKKSVAAFKLREGMKIGASVTLRKEVMFFFLYKLINVALPRIRDFQGVPTKMDGQGNYTLGLSSLEIFPEGENSGVAEFTIGTSVTIVTSTPVDSEAFLCLKSFGMPFKK
jgi:large subunit ribosomal protein L5